MYTREGSIALARAQWYQIPCSKTNNRLTHARTDTYTPSIHTLPIYTPIYLFYSIDVPEFPRRDAHAGSSPRGGSHDAVRRASVGRRGGVVCG